MTGAALPFWVDDDNGVHIQLSSFVPQFHSIYIQEFVFPSCEEIKTMIDINSHYEYTTIKFYLIEN